MPLLCLDILDSLFELIPYSNIESVIFEEDSADRKVADQISVTL